MVSVIIPTLNAEKEIENLIYKLQSQSVQPNEIIVVDSESEDYTIALCKKHNIQVIEIKRNDFDHGRTRDMALRATHGDIVLFLTQDAVPADKYLIENLKKVFADNDVAIAYGRQLPKENATPQERLVRNFNYPPKSHIRTKKDLQQYGIKTYFTSDVCCAYRRSVYLALGGFEYPLKTSEDMFMAVKVINAGYKIVYAADACVYHSHNLTLKQQYERNKIIAYELSRHKHIMNGVKPYGEGLRLVKYVMWNLLKQGRLDCMVMFFFDCCARILGNRMGRV